MRKEKKQSLRRQTKKYMTDVSLFDKVRIGIASSEEIKEWSHGEVKKPETINYRTFRPERDGLFCERIFGPTRDWECTCGRYKKVKYKGMVCERCGVEVTRAKVRRERMGHIELAAPVCHIWYLKGVPSPLSLVLDISPKMLDKVVYFGSFIVIDLEAEKVQEYLPQIRKEVEKQKQSLQLEIQELEEESLLRFASELLENEGEIYDENYVRERSKAVYERIKAEYRSMDTRLLDLDVAVEILDKLERNQLIDEDKHRAVVKLLESIGDRIKVDLRSLVRANIGAEAVKELLNRVELEDLARSLRHEIVSTTTQRRARAIKRLEVVEALISSKSRPEWMILDMIPVISPELRPMVQLDGGRFATSDLNDLYRRIINRNNRLKKIIEIHAPESIINHEKRLLQEAVDALIDNNRRPRPVVGSNQRPLKSLSDLLKGKEGRFRKNLLGKRVDYSGRSVIVVGPHLKLHQCGLPKEMALELFKPFVMKTLVEKKLTPNIKAAKKMIDKMTPAVWDGLEEVIREHPVLLNRAPTLHRLGIQAFEPILVDGKAIQVHPLVCNMYNADFDGDQMAVHLPLSTQAQAEARVLMLSTQNLFSPADGRPTCAPVQDIILGAFAITFVGDKFKADLELAQKAHDDDPKNVAPPQVYKDPNEVLYLLESPDPSQRIHINQPVKVRLKRPIFRPDVQVAFRDPVTGMEYYSHTTIDEDDNGVVEKLPYEQEFETVIRVATPGQLIFNSILPYPMKYADQVLSSAMNKKALAELINLCHRSAGVGATIRLLDDMKDLGFKWATKYGLSVAITDMDPPERREEMIQQADEQSTAITVEFRRGLSSYNGMTRDLINLWTKTYDDIGKAIVDGLEQFNPLNIITVSGARGSVKQLAQLAGMRGLMFNQFNEVIYELPVKNSFHRGLNMLEYFVTTHGARKGLADTALRTADAGYLTRRLCDVAQDVIINEIDCGTRDGVHVHRTLDEDLTIESMSEVIFGRVSLATIIHPETHEVLVTIDEIISREKAAAINALEVRYDKSHHACTTDEEREKVENQFKDMGFDVNEHGMLCLLVRSPLSCELSQGICSKCYGIDLSTFKLAEVGLSVGIIAAQSIGEPGTQLTMRTFHTGGVAGSATIARTNQYKTGRFVRQFTEDFSLATDTDQKNFDPTKLLESQEVAVKNLFLKKDEIPLTINEEPEPSAKKAARQNKTALKAQEKSDNESRKLWERSRKTFFYAWSGKSSGIVRVEEIFEARKQPRGKAIICPVTGTVRSIKDSSYGRFVIIEATVALNQAYKDAYVADVQSQWPKSVKGGYDPDLERHIGQKLTTAVVRDLAKHGLDQVTIYYPQLVPPLGKLPVELGSKVIKGDPLTEGPRDPHEVLDLAGANAVHDYFVENLQSVYKSQGVDINDKHVEVIIRQMLRKRQIKEPGDTPYLPGQIIDRFAFVRANDAVRALIHQGKKIRYIDPITGDNVERDPKEATATWILLGITEASLNTDSFLSAASFQKTTRVLTDAAVRGKKDQLVGLKENVIIGRLIPSGTGVKRYRDVAINVQRGPTWAEQSLTALVETEDGGEFTYDEIGTLSLADFAAEEGTEKE